MKTSRPIRCLVTAGPTREHLDPVRFLSNPSSGKMGYALAVAAKEAGWQVDLVSGPVALPPPEGVKLTRVTTAAEMFRTVEKLFSKCDVLLMCAAVSDFRPKKAFKHKVKKGHADLVVEFEPTVDILKNVAARKRPDQLVVGFAAETQNIEACARKKLKEKDLDFIIANQVGRAGTGFAADQNAVIVLGRDGSRKKYGRAGKMKLAREVIGSLQAATTQLSPP
ncbi:MAG TPA: phosphopantothenoylcysteine decarboxylase [Opitutales bacterium]|jgi:phosphopantothenoylcysteine decarboxylase/phosphopantothenate--cysteine ligase|nr:phosphopantothenoylcysteine decarboxylase [Opitutales bacterium]